MLGHTKIESTVRYLDIEVDDALSMAEQVDLSIYPGGADAFRPNAPLPTPPEPYCSGGET